MTVLATGTGGVLKISSSGSAVLQVQAPAGGGGGTTVNFPSGANVQFPSGANVEFPD